MFPCHTLSYKSVQSIIPPIFIWLDRLSSSRQGQWLLQFKDSDIVLEIISQRAPEKPLRIIVVMGKSRNASDRGLIGIGS